MAAEGWAIVIGLGSDILGMSSKRTTEPARRQAGSSAGSAGSFSAVMGATAKQEKRSGHSASEPRGTNAPSSEAPIEPEAPAGAKGQAGAENLADAAPAGPAFHRASPARPGGFIMGKPQPGEGGGAPLRAANSAGAIQAAEPSATAADMQALKAEASEQTSDARISNAEAAPESAPLMGAVPELAGRADPAATGSRSDTPLTVASSVARESSPVSDVSKPTGPAVADPSAATLRSGEQKEVDRARGADPSALRAGEPSARFDQTATGAATRSTPPVSAAPDRRIDQTRIDESRFSGSVSTSPGSGRSGGEGAQRAYPAADGQAISGRIAQASAPTSAAPMEGGRSKADAVPQQTGNLTARDTSTASTERFGQAASRLADHVKGRTEEGRARPAVNVTSETSANHTVLELGTKQAAPLPAPPALSQSRNDTIGQTGKNLASASMKPQAWPAAPVPEPAADALAAQSAQSVRSEGGPPPNPDESATFRTAGLGLNGSKLGHISKGLPVSRASEDPSASDSKTELRGALLSRAGETSVEEPAPMPRRGQGAVYTDLPGSKATRLPVTAVNDRTRTEAIPREVRGASFAAERSAPMQAPTPASFAPIAGAAAMGDAVPHLQKADQGAAAASASPILSMPAPPVAAASQSAAPTSAEALAASQFGPIGHTLQGLDPKGRKKVTAEFGEPTIGPSPASNDGQSRPLASTASMVPGHGTAGDKAADVMRQLTESIQRGSVPGSVSVALQPEEIGRVRLIFAPMETGYLVTISAERPETLDLLRRHADMLAIDLRDRGFGEATFAFADGGHSGKSDGSGSDETTPAIVPPLGDGEPGADSPMPQSRSSTPAGGLDLRL